MSRPVSVRGPERNIYSVVQQKRINKKEKKLLEDNEKNLDDIEFGSDFSDTIPKACSMRERTNKLDFVKIKFLLYMILLRK